MTTFDVYTLVELEEKHPSATRTRTINLIDPDGTTNDGSAGDTGFLQGRTISSIAVTAPSGLTVDSSSNTTTNFTLTYSGGTHGKTYDIQVDVTLSTNDVEPVIVRVPVVDPTK